MKCLLQSAGCQGALVLIMCSTAWACIVDSDCESGTCVRGWLSHECSKLASSLDGGDACSTDKECKSGSCLSHIMGTDRCQFKPKTLAADAACDVDSECKSGKCFQGYFYKACSKPKGALPKGTDCYFDSECASGKCYQESLLSWRCTSATKLPGGSDCVIDGDCKSNKCYTDSMLLGNKCQYEAGKLNQSSLCLKDSECATGLKCEIEKFWHTQGTCQSVLLQASQLSSTNVNAGMTRCSQHSDCSSQQCIWPYGGVFGWASEGYCRQIDKSIAVGKPCSMDEECTQGNCRSEYLTSVCAPAKASIKAGSPCYASEDCETKSCLGWSVNQKGTCAQLNIDTGAACTYGFQCKTQFCSKGMCAKNGTGLANATCGTHVECASGYCIGEWNPFGGKCDGNKKGLEKDQNCYRDEACKSGVCESRLYREAGFCTPSTGSVAVYQPCSLDEVCASKFCIKGNMVSITGQVCGNKRGSLADTAACKVDQECMPDHLCIGKYLKQGKCTKINTTSLARGGETAEFSKRLSLPQSMLGSSESAVRTFINKWKATNGKWEDVGIVDTDQGKKDLIDDNFELWIYDHLVMVVISIVSEMAAKISATGFGGELETLVEGVLNVNGTEAPSGKESGAGIFKGTDAESLQWIDDIMENDQWFLNTNISGGRMTHLQPLIPQQAIKKMIRQALGMGVGFLESTLKTAEVRVAGRWMKNIATLPAARRLLAQLERNSSQFGVSNTTLEKAEAEQTSLQKSLEPQSDSFIKKFTDDWWEKFGQFAGAAGSSLYGALGGQKVTGGSVQSGSWEKKLFSNMVGIMMMATHRALAVGFEFPFIFDQHIRLQRSDEERQVVESRSGSSYQMHVSAADCAKKAQLAGCDKLKQEKHTDGYGAVAQYHRQQVELNALKTFMEDFSKAQPNISHDGNLGLMHVCDPFNNGQGCVMADLVDDNALMQRFAEMTIAFFASAITNSEVRMFQQRYHMVFKTSSNAELARKFSAYLQKKKTKLPVASIKAWIDARYQSQLIKDKAVDIEKQFKVVIGRETHTVIHADELQKFAVKSVTLCLQFLEMALLDTKVDILGVSYEIIATAGEATFDVAKLSKATKVDVDWTFVDTFVDNWYTKESHTAFPRTSVDVNTFFNVDIGFLVPLEKLICKLSFGAAMDIVNANFQKLDLPLPLVNANKGVGLITNHPTSTKHLTIPSTIMQVSPRVKTADWFKTFIPTLNAGVLAEIAPLDPIRSLRSDPVAVERRIESINAKSTCGYVIRDLKGLSTLKFDKVTTSADLPWGCGSYCAVCTQGKAQGDKCVAKNAAGSAAAGCAVDANKMSTDVEFSGRFLRNKIISIYSRVCTSGKACGDACIAAGKTCTLSTGSAAMAAEVICKVCTGGRKACGDKCVAADAKCTSPAGCARNSGDCADIDLSVHMVSTGKFSFKATELSVQAEVTAKADFCGVPTAKGSCCAGEELFQGKCYASCSKTTGGAQTIRRNACTCTIKDKCAAGEEQFNNQCYKTCSTMSGGTHTIRSGPNTCRRTKKCQDNEEFFNNMCYKKCHLLTNGAQPIRHSTHTCKKSKKCENDEEEFSSKCYKKCSVLTGGSHPIRHGPNSCKKSAKCQSNEEEFENKCYKKCSILTGGERTHRLGAYTCSPTADQIEERLRKAGGGTGEIRVTFSWDTTDDLDIYVQPPGHSAIYYGRKSVAGGKLDVDANAHSRRLTRTPIENVFWPPLVDNRGGPPKGKYKIWMQVYRKRTSQTLKWNAEVKVSGKSHRYSGQIASSGKRRGNKVWLGLHDPHGLSGAGYTGPAAVPPIWEAEQSGSGCSGYGVGGDGRCAQPFYHLFTKGRGCSGFGVASDGKCPNKFYDMVTSGTDCGGYGIAADGGCPNKPFDPWTKGVGCSGFGMSTVGCAVPFYHPTTNCAKFGVAANGGLAHFPGIDPKTLVTKSKLKNFKGACTFKTTVNPQNFNLNTLEVTDFKATWDDVEFKLPELGVFSVQAEAIHTAMSDGLETHFNNLIRKQVRQKLNTVCLKKKADVNKKIDFKKCMRRPNTNLKTSSGRRLTQSDIHEGHLYTVSASGHVEPKVEPAVESSEDEDEPTVAPSPHHMELVNVELVVHGLEYNELDDAHVADLAAATHMATASFVGVAENEVVSLPKRESTSDTTRLALQIFVATSQKDELLAKLHTAQGKAFEAALEGAIKPLALGAAKGEQVLVATDKIVVGDTTTSFTNVVTQDDSIFT